MSDVEIIEFMIQLQFCEIENFIDLSSNSINKFNLIFNPTTKSLVSNSNSLTV